MRLLIASAMLFATLWHVQPAVAQCPGGRCPAQPAYGLLATPYYSAPAQPAVTYGYYQYAPPAVYAAPGSGGCSSAEFSAGACASGQRTGPVRAFFGRVFGRCR